MHLASTIVKMLVPGYIDNIADVNFNDDRMLGLGADFLTMFRRNHSSNFRIVPNLDKNSKLKVGMEKTLDQKNVLYTFNFNKNKNLINPITLLGEDTFAPMITYDDTLLVYHSNGNGFVQYVSTSPLGNNNNAIEYDANMGGLEMMSAISESTLNMEQSEDTTPTKDLFYDENLTINQDNAYDTAIEGYLQKKKQQNQRKLMAIKRLKNLFIISQRRLYQKKVKLIQTTKKGQNNQRP